MTSNEAITHAYRLWKKWVSARPAVGVNGYLIHSHETYKAFDLDYIHNCMLREYRWIRSGKVTPGLIREVKGELVLLGKIRKALTEGICRP